MPPLTLTILASVLQMHGSDATITSDNKGVEDLLRAIRGQLQAQTIPNSPRIMEATYHRGIGPDYWKSSYAKYYKSAGTLEAKPIGGSGTKPASGASTKPVSGTRR